MARDVRIAIVGDAKKLKAATAEAEGAIDKLARNAQSSTSKKFGPSGMLGELTSGFGGLPVAIAGAGAALAGFVAKGLGDFQRMATEAQQIAASTQMSVENASKWQATLKRMGVDASAGDIADVVLNISQKGEDLKKLGIYATDSSTRLEKLIDYMSNVSDETERATLMSKFFGEEGARQFGILVASAGEYKKVKEDLNSSEIITQDEVEKANKLRDAANEFNAAWKDFQQRVATDAAGPAAATLNAGTRFLQGQGLVNPSDNPKGFWGNFWNEATKAAESFTGGWIENTKDAEAEAKAAAKRAADAQEQAMMDAARATDDAYSFMSDAAADNAYAIAQQQAKVRWELGATQRAVDGLAREHGAFADAISKSRWVDGYVAQMKQMEDAGKRAITTERDLQRAIQDRMNATLSGLDAELNLADARSRLADATARGGQAFGAWQSGEGSQQQFDAAFRDEQRAILAAADAAGRLAEFWGADAQGQIQAQITELQRIQRDTPAQTEFINRVIDLLVGAFNAPTAPVVQSIAGFLSKGSTVVNVTGGADPYLSLTAAQQYAARNGTPAAV